MSTILESFFWASAIALAAPLLLAALGEIVTERAGMFTVGIEGYMLAGAFSTVAAAIVTGSPGAGLFIAMVVGSLLGALYGLGVAYARADQVVIGIGFNLVILGLTSMLRRVWFPTGMSAPDVAWLGRTEIPGLAKIPWLGNVLFNQSPIVYVLYALVPVVGWLLIHSRPGLLVRAVGDGAIAANSHGVPVLRTRLVAMTVNGLLCGAAGGTLVLVSAGGIFVDNMVNGRGYLVLALVMFSRWRPAWAAVGAVLFGAADSLQYIGQAAFGNAIPPAAFLMAPFILALVAWVLIGNRSPAPSDMGRPFLD